MPIRRLFIGLCSVFFLIPTSFAAYRDVPTDHQFIRGITYVELNGASDARKDFYPDQTINRAEATKLIFSVFGENGDNITYQSNFKDVPVDAWYAPFMQLAAQNGLFTSEDGEIFPGRVLRRAEAYRFLLNAYGFGHAIIPQSEREQLFTDVGTNHTYYEDLKRVSDLGLLYTNSKLDFLPYQTLTRGEFAQMIYAFDSLYLSSTTKNDFYKSDIVGDVWDLITEQFYVDDDFEIDQEALFHATVRGLVESLNDPYTTFFPPEEGDQFITTINGHYEGIGAFLFEDTENGEVSVSGFLPGSPAEEKGMQEGDVILEVDDESVTNKTLEQVATRIRGEEGTEVKLKIRRGSRELEFVITRKALTAEVAWGEVFNGNAWLLTVKNFTGEMRDQVAMAFAKLEKLESEPEAIIIDLRGNSGGLVNLANELSGYFLPDEAPLMEFKYNTNEFELTNKVDGPYQGIPLYILVNGQTASASEIVTATLMEQANATVVGTQTFGKGTAQQIDTFWDGSVIKYTVAEWLTSEGNSIRDIGITPDYKVTDSSDRVDEWLEKVKNLLD